MININSKTVAVKTNRIVIWRIILHIVGINQTKKVF